jgi:hypothetical protein
MGSKVASGMTNAFEVAVGPDGLGQNRSQGREDVDGLADVALSGGRHPPEGDGQALVAVAAAQRGEGEQGDGSSPAG